MTYVWKGMAAGAFGALVLAVLMLVQAELGLSEPDWIGLLGGAIGAGRAGGWAVHFLVGLIWGGLFAWLDPDLPGDSLRQRGVVFASSAWLVMMLAVLPLAGAGLFGLRLGIFAPLYFLALHAVFGAVMGKTYDWLFVQAVPLRYRGVDGNPARIRIRR